MADVKPLTPEPWGVRLPGLPIWANAYPFGNVCTSQTHRGSWAVPTLSKILSRGGHRDRLMGGRLQCRGGCRARTPRTFSTLQTAPSSRPREPHRRPPALCVLWAGGVSFVSGPKASSSGIPGTLLDVQSLWLRPEGLNRTCPPAASRGDSRPR